MSYCSGSSAASKCVQPQVILSEAQRAQLVQLGYHEIQANLAVICCQTQSSIPCSTSCCYFTWKWPHGWKTLLSSTRGSVLLLEPPPTSSISGVQPPSQEQGSGESGPPAEDQQLNTAKNARQPSSGSFANVPLCFQLLSSAIETKQTHTSNQHFPYSTLFSDFLQYKSYYKEIYLLSDVFGNMPTLPPVPELPLR